MSLTTGKINKDAFVTDIVVRDFRTASVFRKYGVDFCCGARYPLEAACAMRGLDLATVKNDLERATVNLRISNSLAFEKWGLGFLSDFIVHIHHDFLRLAIPEAKSSLLEFAGGHRKKYSYLNELENIFTELADKTLPHLLHEEEIIFPYIRQVEHAHATKESYAGLLVRTLSKPIADVMRQQHDMVDRSLRRIRELTDGYTPPVNACTNHKVCFSLLHEIDEDMNQHMHFEKDILYPRAIAMEKELLQMG